MKNSTDSFVLDPLFGSHAVIRRDVPFTLKGRGLPGRMVRASIAGADASGTCGGDGIFRLEFPALPEGGPFTLVVQDDSSRVESTDIHFGEVWFCAGQSNMMMPASRLRDRFPAEMEATDLPLVRVFHVPEAWRFDDPPPYLAGGSWKVSHPASVDTFAALPLFLGRDIHAGTGCAVGMVVSALGGAPIEAFLPEEDLADRPDALAALQECRDPDVVQNRIDADDRRIQAWQTDLASRDAGNASGWHREEAWDQDWATTCIPGRWDQVAPGFMNGSVWYHKDVDLPAGLAGNEAILRLGCIVDSDQAWVNGQWVGSTGYQYPPRRYNVPAGVLHAGINRIAIRVTSEGGVGGFIPDKPYSLTVGTQVIDLAGSWRWRLGARAPALEGRKFFQWQPTALWRAMMAPLEGLRVSGAVWYQGESNADLPGAGKLYPVLMQRLASRWKELFHTGALPLYLVQLPELGNPVDGVQEGSWAAFRQAQSACLSLPDCHLVVSLGCGEWNDIHPVDKITLAGRLAKVILGVQFGHSGPVRGPVPGTVRASGPGRWEVTFEADTLPLRKGQVAGCALQDADGTWYPVTAGSDGSRVVLESGNVKSPKALRYAWADCPAGADLCGESGLAASPFHLDMQG